MIDVKSIVPTRSFLGRYLEYTEPFEYPDSYALFSILACASAAVEGRLVVNPDTEPSPQPNVFVVLYGPSGSRKGTAIRHAVDILAEARSETPVLPTSFTREALIGYLSRESDIAGRVSGLIVSEEFADLIGGAEYCLQTTKFLTQMWDCRPVWVNETRAHGREVIENAYVVLLGSSAPDWLEGIDPSTLAGGFLRRLLLVVEAGSKRQNPHPVRCATLRAGLVRDFAEAFGESNLPRGARMRLTPAAERRERDWYSEVAAWKSALGEREGHFANTIHAHVLKVAALVQLLDGGGHHAMSEESFELGVKLIAALTPGTFEAYASLVPTPFARLRASVMRIVRASGGEMSDAEIERAVVATRGVRPKEVSEAKVSLINEGLLVRTGSGRVRGK